MKITYPLALSAILGTAFGAAILPRDEPIAPNSCCFHLQDTRTGKLAQQDYNSGFLYVNDPSLPVGWYCLYNDQPILWDPNYNACILTSPKNSFQCLDGTPGGDTWNIVQGQPNTILLQDYSSVWFSICSVNGRQQIYGPNLPSNLNCQSTQLVAVGRKGQCKL